MLLTTVRIGVVTTLLCSLLGYALGYYLIRIMRLATLRRVLVILTVLPLFTSNVIRSFAWMVLLGRGGVVNETLLTAGLVERPVKFLGSETGIIIGLSYILLPIVILNIANALAPIDPALEEAAADLGAKPAATFWLVTFPLTLPSLIASAMTVFALSISAYVTPAILSGGKITVFSMLIFQQYGATLDFPFGAALAVLLLMTATVITITARNVHSPAGVMQ